MRKKLLMWLLLGALAVASLTACSGSGTSESGKVYWLNYKPEADAALQNIAKVYTEQTGVPVKVVTAAQNTYIPTLMTELDKSAAPTMFVLRNVGDMEMWKDYCYDLKDTDVYKEMDSDEFVLRDQNDKVCGIGYCYESFGIITNTKLLKKAGYRVKDIKNFDSLKAIADDIHSRAQELGFDAFTSSGMDGTSSWRFTGHLINLPLYYEAVEDDWTECPPRITGKYMDNYKKIWDLYTTDSAYKRETLATGGYDAEKEFIDGKAVFYQNGTWEYSALSKSENYSPKDMKMIPIYCGVEGEENAGVCSGTENNWAVNLKAKENDIQATLDFMYWLVTSEEGTEMMAEEFGAIPYKNGVASDNVFIKDAEKYEKEGKYNVSWLFSLTPNYAEWRAGLAAALNKYDAGKEGWDKVKTAVVDGWARQYEAATR